MLNTAVGHHEKGASVNGNSAPLSSASKNDEKLDLCVGMVGSLTSCDFYNSLASASRHFKAS